MAPSWSIEYGRERGPQVAVSYNTSQTTAGEDRELIYAMHLHDLPRVLNGVQRLYAMYRMFHPLLNLHALTLLHPEFGHGITH